MNLLARYDCGNDKRKLCKRTARNVSNQKQGTKTAGTACSVMAENVDCIPSDPLNGNSAFLRIDGVKAKHTAVQLPHAGSNHN